MKKALVVVLILVVVVTGLPIVMGMSGMANCFDCGPATLAGTACGLAILAAGVVLLLALLGHRLRDRRQAMALMLHSFLLERPPRLA